MVLLSSLCKELLIQNISYHEVLAILQKTEDVNFPGYAGLLFKKEDHLVINPTLLGALERKEQLVLIQHELLHYINLHHLRRANKDPETWNLACDFAVNSLLKDKLTDKLLELLVTPDMFNFPTGQSAEWYYESLLKNNLFFSIANHQYWKTFNNFSANNVVSWKTLLKQYLRYSLIGKKVSSNKRTSRRFGNPPGKKRLKIPPKLLIAIDVSTSVIESLDIFSSEIVNIAQEVRIPTTVIEFSDRLYTQKSLASFTKASVRQCSQTFLNPVIREAESYTCSVIFTDGKHSDANLLNCSKPLIWVYPINSIKVKATGKHIWLH